MKKEMGSKMMEHDIYQDIKILYKIMFNFSNNDESYKLVDIARDYKGNIIICSVLYRPGHNTRSCFDENTTSYMVLSQNTDPCWSTFMIDFNHTERADITRF